MSTKKQPTRRTGKRLPHVLPPPGRALPRVEHKVVVFANVFVSSVLINPSAPEVSVAAWVAVDGVRQWLRISLPRFHPEVVHFLSGPCDVRGYSYARLPPVGPYRLSGILVGSDLNPELDNAQNLPTAVIGDVSLKPLAEPD
jgi:hypothetical protein